MRTAGIAPTELELRAKLVLPPDAKFLNWAVHVPGGDEFLYAQTGNGEACVRAFGRDAARALKFTTAGQAGRVAAQLRYPAVIVAVFEMGSRFGIIPVGGNELSSFRS